MRGIVAGLIATCIAGSSAEAAPRSEWVVLRVERVEVAIAHADGRPWDDDATAAHEPPDLGIRLPAGAVGSYVSPIAENRLVHDFRYEVLVPLEAVPPDGLAVEVLDQDGTDPRSGEPLGTIRVTRKDIADLLASSSRVKTLSDDSVTRLEVTARRYRRRSKKEVATVTARKREVPFATPVIAGELIEVRATKADGIPTVIIGAARERLVVGRCLRALVGSSGEVTATLDGSGAGGARFALRVLEPSLAMWTRGHGWVPCDGRRVDGISVAAVSQLRTLNGTSLAAGAVEAIVQSRYLAGVQRCHERRLRLDPMSAGRLRLRFTVGATGGVIKATSNGVERSVEACVQSLMTRWRFGAPKDADGNPTAEDVEAEVLLDAR